jgi:hypothetical protein
VSDARPLGEIHRLARLNRISYTAHALRRMDQRGAELADVRAALISSTAAVHQEERGTWRVDGGRDRDGDDLTVIVDIEADLVVVTIF